MEAILSSLQAWVYPVISLITHVDIKSIIEIAIIAALVYKMLEWIMDSRAWTLLKGILFIFGFFIIAYAFNLSTILWLLERISYIAVTALLIIFQPELRRALEQLGSRNMLKSFLPVDAGGVKTQVSEETRKELVRACFEMGRQKTGALIVIERESPLREIEQTGIRVDAVVTSQLLINIFEHNTPLHDGAVVIRDDRVSAATCYLPLSDNMSISKALGTRHRAALGVSEATDSVTLVVSEETGHVSVALNGTLTRMKTPEELTRLLDSQFRVEKETGNRWNFLKGRKKNEETAGE